MITTRITERASAYATMGGLQYSASKLSQLQSQLSSGRQITKPSDSPSGTASALQLRGQNKRLEQYTANAQDGTAWLSQVDTALSSVSTAVQGARTLIIQGLNSGTVDLNAREALAQQVDALRASAIGFANTTYVGRPVFGGTTAGTLAFDASGSYVGNSGTITRTVGDDATVQINQVGTDVFGPNGSNLFDVLANVANDLRTNPAGLSGDLTALDKASSTVIAQQSLAGATYQRITSVQSANASASTQVTTALSQLQDVDIADMAVQVSAAQLAYQAALQTTANIRQTSLLDFLK